MEMNALDTWHNVSILFEKIFMWRFLSKDDQEKTENSNIIDELLNRENYTLKYVLPFKNELFNNTLGKDLNSQKDVLKFYLASFIEINDFFCSHRYIFHDRLIRDSMTESYINIVDETKWNELSRIDKYLFCLWLIMNDFFMIIQKSCLIFKIDFLEICAEVGIEPVVTRVDIAVAIRIEQLWLLEKTQNEELQKSDNQIEHFSKENSASQFIKDNHEPKEFIAYFNDKKNCEKLAEICETIFGVHESKKVDAIMVCILTQNGFITLADKRRKAFFIAWYKHSKKKIPKKENFAGINNFIVDRGIQGLCFKNSEDFDYLDFQSKFLNHLEIKKLSPK